VSSSTSIPQHFTNSPKTQNVLSSVLACWLAGWLTGWFGWKTHLGKKRERERVSNPVPNLILPLPHHLYARFMCFIRLNMLFAASQQDPFFFEN